MKHIDEFLQNGFATINNIYTMDEIEKILLQVSQANTDKEMGSIHF